MSCPLKKKKLDLNVQQLLFLFVACCYNKCFPGVAAMSVPRMLYGVPATELKLVTMRFPVHAPSFGKEQKRDPIFVIKTSCQV